MCFGYFPRAASERADQRAGLLSGGEQQMLAISRALMGRPKLLLLDEPSLGLSPILVTQEIFGIIRRINREQGVAILLVEQNATHRAEDRRLRLHHRGRPHRDAGYLRQRAGEGGHQGILSRPEGIRACAARGAGRRKKLWR
jgi:energy-coupling factor transporter ATP-binding protein EcfA2